MSPCRLVPVPELRRAWSCWPGPLAWSRTGSATSQTPSPESEAMKQKDLPWALVAISSMLEKNYVIWKIGSAVVTIFSWFRQWNALFNVAKPGWIEPHICQRLKMFFQLRECMGNSRVFFTQLWLDLWLWIGNFKHNVRGVEVYWTTELIAYNQNAMCMIGTLKNGLIRCYVTHCPPMLQLT